MDKRRVIIFFMNPSLGYSTSYCNRYYVVVDDDLRHLFRGRNQKSKFKEKSVFLFFKQRTMNLFSLTTIAVRSANQRGRRLEEFNFQSSVLGTSEYIQSSSDQNRSKRIRFSTHKINLVQNLYLFCYISS